MKTYEEQIDAGLAYARATLSARLTEPKRREERERDATLALAIIALVAAKDDAQTRAIGESTQARSSANVTSEPEVDEPVVINFERARASFRTSNAPVLRARALDRRGADRTTTRLALYRGE